MSVDAVKWVFEHGPSDKSELLVLLSLAERADEDGSAYPSVADTAERARMTERGARKILRRLEAAGWLKTVVGGGRGGTSIYTLIMPENPEQQFPLSERNPEPGTRNESANPEQQTRNVVPLNPENPERESINPEPECTKPGTVVPPNHQGTIKEPSIPPKSPTDILCQIVRPETATDFASHRKAMRKPLTLEAATRLVKKLADHPDPDAVFDMSIENGWQGVFPERIKGGPHGKSPKPDPTLDAIAQAAAFRRSPGANRC